MTSYRYIGYGTTNSNGVAHLDHDPQGNPINGYVGTGAGEVDVIASTDNPIVEGSIVSETYNVLDTFMYDDGTNTDDYFDYGSRTTRTSSDGVVTLLNNQTGSLASYVMFNKHGTSHSSSSEVTEWGEDDFCIELDLISSDHTDNAFWFSDGSEKTKSFNALNAVGKHIKVTCIDGTISFKVDNTDYTGFSAPTSPFRCGFFIYPTKQIQFKDLKIYPI